MVRPALRPHDRTRPRPSGTRPGRLGERDRQRPRPRQDPPARRCRVRHPTRTQEPRAQRSPRHWHHPRPTPTPTHPRHATQTRLVGKESNKLLQRLTHEATDPGEYHLDLGSRENPWHTLVLPILRELGAQRLIAATGAPAARSMRPSTVAHPPMSVRRNSSLLPPSTPARTYGRGASRRPDGATRTTFSPPTRVTKAGANTAEPAPTAGCRFRRPRAPTLATAQCAAATQAVVPAGPKPVPVL
jgi:hypothetical protein